MLFYNFSLCKGFKQKIQNYIQFWLQKDISVRPNSIPKCHFHYDLFSLATCMSRFVQHSLFCSNRMANLKSKSNNIIAKNSGSACMYTSILEFCLFC